MKLKALLAALTTAAFTATGASAAIVGVAGDVVQIAPPANVNNATPGDNDVAKAFDELQQFTLTSALTTDQGIIAAGTTISSHMILFNRASGSASVNASGGVSFSGDVLGTMSDLNGALLDASDYLGAPGTTYQSGFSNRGLESNDSLTLVPTDSVLFSFNVSQPGDWVRVITEAPAPVPVPAAGALLLLGLGALGVARGRKS